MVGSRLSYKEEEGMGEEKTKSALLLDVEEEKAVGAALLGLGGGKRIPCVGMGEGVVPALFFGFIFLFGILLPA